MAAALTHACLECFHLQRCALEFSIICSAISHDLQTYVFGNMYVCVHDARLHSESALVQTFAECINWCSAGAGFIICCTMASEASQLPGLESVKH